MIGFIVLAFAVHAAANSTSPTLATNATLTPTAPTTVVPTSTPSSSGSSSPSTSGHPSMAPNANPTSTAPSGPAPTTQAPGASPSTPFPSSSPTAIASMAPNTNPTSSSPSAVTPTTRAPTTNGGTTMVPSTSTFSPSAPSGVTPTTRTPTANGSASPTTTANNSSAVPTTFSPTTKYTWSPTLSPTTIYPTTTSPTTGIYPTPITSPNPSPEPTSQPTTRVAVLVWVSAPLAEGNVSMLAFADACNETFNGIALEGTPLVCTAARNLKNVLNGQKVVTPAPQGNFSYSLVVTSGDMMISGDNGTLLGASIKRPDGSQPNTSTQAWTGCDAWGSVYFNNNCFDFTDSSSFGMVSTGLTNKLTREWVSASTPSVPCNGGNHRIYCYRNLPTLVMPPTPQPTATPPAVNQAGSLQGLLGFWFILAALLLSLAIA